MKEKRYFEWIDGDDKGTVVILDYIEEDEDSELYVFNDGTSCYKEYISPMTTTPGDFKTGKPKFMVEVESPTNIWGFEDVTSKTVRLHDETVVAPSLEEIVADNNGGSAPKQRMIPPRQQKRLRDLPRKQDYPEPKKESPKPIENPKQQTSQVPNDYYSEPKFLEEPKASVVPNGDTSSLMTPDMVAMIAEMNRKLQEQTSQTSGYVAKDKISDKDPVYILVTTSKKDDITVSMDLEMKLPSKDLFAIASSNFDNGEEKFIETIIQDLDISEIIESLKESLLSTYRSATEIEKSAENFEDK